MNKLQNKFRITSIIIIVFAFLSCNAPHNNPLDSLNPNNKISTLEGTIKTISVPQQAIADAEIFWEGENILSKTNNDGYFIIKTIKQVNGWLKVNKVGFSSDSLFVAWEGERNISISFNLNAKPQIDSLLFYSIVINKHPTKQKYSLLVKIRISDLENDVDTVVIENKILDVSKKMLYNLSTRFYEKKLKVEDLQINDIDEVIGKDFEIAAFDKGNKKFLLGKTNIKRIIKREVKIYSPSGRDTVKTGKPFLQWERFKPGFKFVYLAEIYTDEVSEELVWAKEIFLEEINYNVESKLPSGEYFWVIWAIDEFGNRCRSKEASFIVE
ncbi:MAG: hypothetical protein V3V16_04105 [Melioribacteraceae bacterium]